MKIQNYDIEDDENNDFVQLHNFMPDRSFRMLRCAPSGSGKTNLLLDMIYRLLYYDKIYLYARNLQMSKYKHLLKKFDPISQKCGYDIILQYNIIYDIIYNITVNGFVNNFHESPHRNKKAYDITLQKDAGTNNYRSRLGFNLYPLPIGTYTIIFEFFPPEMTNIQLSVHATSAYIHKHVQKDFSDYSKMLVRSITTVKTHQITSI